ncbi:sugar phosphotransferase [Lactobacillus sp. CBA3606]|uniref:Stealth CR1 domain-containing protein n=1 Tax=Lactobacillus sp. CBA3606 TaxID=2099789 RepID=UPI000CFD1E62|nr:Stealth CR1 domain-containing protein [Lactobacillus sp. CBA3606]AVK63331.1 sugar phosphotransferase [Lactobacillus sp. CBA3606]
MDSIKFPVDFVVTWVNDNDSNWQQKRAKYEQLEHITKASKDDEDSQSRYRDFGLFKYWFRAVEANASWVHKIYVVTDSQVPDFLNLNNPKIEIIDHATIINKRYLPTFDSNTIDWNLYKIPGLVEHFVYFNDDFFINRPVSKNDFFTAKGAVKDTIGQSVIMPVESYDYSLVNNTMKVNQLVNKKEILKAEWQKFFSLRQGLSIFLLNVFFSVFPRFTRLYDAHTAYSFTKTDMKAAADMLEPELSHTFLQRFRTSDDYSIQFVRYYQIILNHAQPRSMYFGQTANTDNPEKAKRLLFKTGKVKLVNINDVQTATDANLDAILSMFKKRFPDVSNFEKGEL